MKTWTLTDVAQDLYVEQIALGPQQAGGAADRYSVIKRTLSGGPSQGVDVIEVDNGQMRFVVVPTRGMGIWRATAAGVQLGWQSPVHGPVHPSLVRLWEPSGIGWLDGFDELLVRCGLESNGAPEFGDSGQLIHPLHGRVANIPAHKVEVGIGGDSGEIVVSGEVDEARLFGNKQRLTTQIKTTVGRPGLTVVDTVTNISAEPTELELLYHINFGVPLLEPGSKAVLPANRVVPRDAVAVENLGEWSTYGPESPGLSEAVFFFELAATDDGMTQTLLRNAAGERGVSLRFNRNELPCFALWKNRQAATDGYVTGLEPGINFPNCKSFEKQQGRVATLAPGESRSFTIEMDVHPDAAAVAAAEQAVAALMQGASPEVSPLPDPTWCQ